MFSILRACSTATLVFSAIFFSQTLSSTSTLAQSVKQSTRPLTETEQVVRDYILKNPEVIIEALQILEDRREAEQNEQQKLSITRNKDDLESSVHQTILGNPEGDVTLIEFFDYNCAFCRESLQHIEKLVEEDNNLRVVLKEFPVLGPGSQAAARVAIAAAKIDSEKYLELHVKLLKTRGQADERVALLLAEGLGYDMSVLRTMMEKPVIEEAITEVYGLANVIGLTGTPTFIIGSEVLPGAVGHSILKQKIDSMRECGETVCS
ncbi:MAG: DsbA family protein [Hyphomicrobiales bacterium]